MRGEMDTKDVDVNDMTVPMLWREIKRLKANAPPNTRKASLKAIVQEERSKELQGNVATGTRGRKRKNNEDNMEEESAGRNNASNVLHPPTTNDDAMSRRVNAVETSLISLTSSVNTLLEKLGGNQDRDPVAAQGSQMGRAEYSEENQLNRDGLIQQGQLLEPANGSILSQLTRDGLKQGQTLEPANGSMLPFGEGFAKALHSPSQLIFPGSSTSSTNTAISNAKALLAVPKKGIAGHSISKINLVTPHQRSEIISGKDYNLARLLIPDSEDFTHKEYLFNSDGDAVPIKAKVDSRLTRNLSLPEFLRAYGIWESVMVETYPHRAAELAQYRYNIIEMHNDFGNLFYQYHKAFSAKAAAALLNHRIKIDWSIVDYKIHMNVFSGRRANSCSLCQGVDHNTDMCSLNVGSRNNAAAKRMSGFEYQNKTSTRPKRKTLSDGTEVCYPFNENKCWRGETCKNAHVCLKCLSKDHIQSDCISASNRAQASGSGSKTQKSVGKGKN